MDPNLKRVASNLFENAYGDVWELRVQALYWTSTLYWREHRTPKQLNITLPTIYAGEFLCLKIISKIAAALGNKRRTTVRARPSCFAQGGLTKSIITLDDQ